MLARTLPITILLLTACATAEPRGGAASIATATISPAEAIELAAAAAPNGIRGTFAMTVQATGRAGANRLHLNSEADYRDQRNLSISIPAALASTVLQRAGARRDEDLKGRAILVDGVAERVRIDFTNNGLPTGKYYYQTHVRITSANQIRLL